MIANKVEIGNYNILSNLKTACVFTAVLFVLTSLHILLGWSWLLMFAFRHGVVASSKFVSGLRRPWTFKDVLFLEDYNQRHRETPVTLLTLHGDISCATIRQLFTQNVLTALIKEGSSNLKFPELTQRRRVFLGFLFWENDPCFSIESHIEEVFFGDQNTPECFNSLENMMEEFSQRPYLRNASPWEIWVVRNFPGGANSTTTATTTLLLWRCHHSLADGHSIRNILINSLGQKSGGGGVPQSKLLKPPEKTSDSFNIFSLLADFLRGFYTLHLDLAHNRWLQQRMVAERRKKGALVDTDKVHFKFSSQLPLAQVKGLAARLGVRVPVLLTTLAAHSFAKAFHSELDANLFVPYGLPLANHPETLANHMSLGGVRLPLSKSLSFPSRLTSIKDSFLGLSSDRVNGVISYFEWILGNCPAWVVGFVKTHTSLAYAPLYISNIVWDSQGFEVGGLQVGSISACMAPTRNATDSIIGIQGFANHVHMTFNVNDVLLCEEDVEIMSAGIGKDFEKLLLENTKD